MNLTALALRFRWLQMPTGVLILLLQRTPVLRVAVQLENAFSANAPAILRSAFAVLAMGAYNSLAGATTFNVNATPVAATPTSGLADAKFTVPATAGTPMSVSVSVSGSPVNAKSWSVTGNLPAGLSVTGGNPVNVTAPYKMTIAGTPTVAGTFPVTVTAWAGAGATSDNGRITVTFNVTSGVASVAPTITTQPVSLAVTAGGPASFTVVASGTPTPTYQWRKNGVNIAGATSTTCSITNAAASDAGSYTAVATNSAGVATSAVATLTVNAAATAPAFTLAPVGLTVTGGKAATFSAAASGSPVPTLQWQSSPNGSAAWGNLGNDSVYSGVTTGTLMLSTTTATMADTQYRCVATNSAGSVNSAAAVLVILTTSGKYNLDAKADILWHNTSTGLVCSWLTGSGFEVFGTEGGGWSVIGTGDFDGDGRAEVLWHDTASGLVASWTSSGGFMTFGSEGDGWFVLGTGDLDGDGRTDVLWHNTSTGLVASWTSTAGFSTYGTEGGGWAVIGTGDFDGDGKADLLWHNSTTGAVSAVFTAGGGLSLGTESGGLQVIGLGDFNGDGKADLLWHNTATGAVTAAYTGGGGLNLGTEGDGWQVLGTGDYDGDGRTDVLWHNTSTGLVASWTSGGGFTVFGVEGDGWGVID